MGPFRQTLVRWMEASVAGGSGIPASLMLSSPASWRSQARLAPAASRMDVTDAVISGPIPSPGRRVTVRGDGVTFFRPFVCRPAPRNGPGRGGCGCVRSREATRVPRETRHRLPGSWLRLAGCARTCGVENRRRSRRPDSRTRLRGPVRARPEDTLLPRAATVSYTHLRAHETVL